MHACNSLQVAPSVGRHVSLACLGTAKAAEHRRIRPRTSNFARPTAGTLVLRNENSMSCVRCCSLAPNRMLSYCVRCMRRWRSRACARGQGPEARTNPIGCDSKSEARTAGIWPLLVRQNACRQRNVSCHACRHTSPSSHSVHRRHQSEPHSTCVYLSGPTACHQQCLICFLGAQSRTLHPAGTLSICYASSGPCR